MKIQTLSEYTPEMATRVRELLIQLSRSGKDRGEIPREWFEEVINSPYHEMFLAVTEESDEDAGGSVGADEKGSETALKSAGQIVGIATLSIIMGPIIRKNAYLEDFVTDAAYRGQGVGTALWEAMLKWAKEHGCKELNFTSGHGREKAHAFYARHGAEIYDTNFFKRVIE